MFARKDYYYLMEQCPMVTLSHLFQHHDHDDDDDDHGAGKIVPALVIRLIVADAAAAAVHPGIEVLLHCVPWLGLEVLQCCARGGGLVPLLHSDHVRVQLTMLRCSLVLVLDLIHLGLNQHCALIILVTYSVSRHCCCSGSWKILLLLLLSWNLWSVTPFELFCS